MIETINPKVSVNKRATLEVEIHRSPGQDEDPAERGTEGNEMSRLESETIPVEQGWNLATSTETFGRDQLSKLSDVSIEKPAVEGSPTELTFSRWNQGRQPLLLHFHND